MFGNNVSSSRNAVPENVLQNHVVISPPDNFDFLKPELWPFWKQRFERYLRLVNLSGKTDSEKIDILCYAMGLQSEAILVHEVSNTDEKSLADVLQAFTNHFCCIKKQEEDLNIASYSKSVNHVKTKENQTASMNEIMWLFHSRNYQEMHDFKETPKKYKPTVQEKVQLIMDNLTSQNFDNSVEQIEALEIMTSQELREIVDIVYNKAIEDTSVMELSARMCGRLSTKHVRYSGNRYGDRGIDKHEISILNFKTLIEARVEMDYGQYCSDEKKKLEAPQDLKNIDELLPASAMEVKNRHIKSLRNFGFMGELFNQKILSFSLWYDWCYRMQTNNDEESLECFYEMLSRTSSRWFMSQNEFEQMEGIASYKGYNKFSPIIRLKIQDLIARGKIFTRELSPEDEDAQESAEQVNPDDLIKESGRSESSGNQTQDSVEPSKFESKPPPMDDSMLANENVFQSSTYVSTDLDVPKTVMPNLFTVRDNIASEPDKHPGILPFGVGSTSTGLRDNNAFPLAISCKAISLKDETNNNNAFLTSGSVSDNPASTMSEEQLTVAADDILRKYLSSRNFVEVGIEIKNTFDDSTFATFVKEILNAVMKESADARHRVCTLMNYLLAVEILPLSVYLAGLGKVLDTIRERAINAPDIWVHVAELIRHPWTGCVQPFAELKVMMTVLKSRGFAGKIMGELMVMLVKENGTQWVKDKWEQSELTLMDVLERDEFVPDFFKKYKLEFLLDFKTSDSSNLVEYGTI